MVLILYGCQFIFPTFYLDGEPLEEKINDNFYIIECFSEKYCLVKSHDNELDEVIIENLDSICFINKNEIYLNSNEKYYLISERDIVEIDRINYKMVSINNYLNN